MNDDPYGDNYLAHYGVPGMKWGVRRGALGVANRVRGNFKRTSRRIGKVRKATNTRAKRTALKKDFKQLGKEVKAGVKAQNAADKARRAKDIARIKKVAAPKIKNALIAITGTSVNGKNKKLGGVSQAYMRKKGQDNINGYLKLAGKQVVVGVALVAGVAAIESAYR